MEDKSGVQDVGMNNSRTYEWKVLFTTTSGRGSLVAVLLCLGAITVSWLGGPIAEGIAGVIAISGLTTLLLVANFLTFGWCKKFVIVKDEVTGVQKIHWPSFVTFVGVTALMWTALIAIMCASIKAILQAKGG